MLVPTIHNHPIPKWASTFAGLLNLPTIAYGHFFGVYNPLEKAILSELCQQLGAHTRTVFTSQLEEINLIQYAESTSGSELNFFRIALSGVINTRLQKFELNIEEILMATIFFSVTSGERIRADIFVINGNFFSIEFNRRIHQFRNCDLLKNIVVQVTEPFLI